MNISYIEPLSRAWDRMKRMLFRPFHIETWFVVGFAAFLAHLFTHTGSVINYNFNSPFRSSGTHHTWDAQTQATVEHVRDSVLNFLEKPLVLLALAVGLVFFMVVLVVLAWVSARAEFVFLENVDKRRGAFMEPWRRFGREGRSLFLWRAGFSFAYLVPLALAVVPFVRPMVTLLRTGSFEMPRIGLAIVCVLGAVMIFAVLAWICWLMDTFVVPLMYRHGENATQAWGRFGRLFGAQIGSFLAFTAFTVVLWLGVTLAIVIVGVGTCCIGLALMVIPYIGSVVLLPVSITARAYGPEFLGQFGAEWTILEPVADENDEPEAPAPVV